LQKVGAQADIAAGVLKSIGGVINANSKYSQISNRNSFNIQMAEIQEMQVASDTQTRILREGTKGKARGQNAQLAAVAQGQSANGDLARTAMSNEDVYAAENQMAIEINSARQIFGLQTQERQLRSDTSMAEINRDLEMSQAIAGGALDIGMGFSRMP